MSEQPEKEQPPGPLSSEEVEVLRGTYRNQRRQAFMAELQVLQDKHRIVLRPTPVPGPPTGGPAVIVSAVFEFVPYEDLPGGRPGKLVQVGSAETITEG